MMTNDDHDQLLVTLEREGMLATLKFREEYDALRQSMIDSKGLAWVEMTEDNIELEG